MDLALQTFHKFAEDLVLILNDNLFDIIIHGSYVLDDFRPNQGDLDFIVLTHENLDEISNRRLISLHKKYRSEKLLLTYQLEGTYYPKFFMENSFLGLYIGTGRMKFISSRENSFIDLRLVKQCGVKILGSSFEMYNPTETEILIEQKLDCRGFKQTISQSGTLDAGFWIALIHASARTLFYRANRRIASKTEACQWCIEQPEIRDFYELFVFAKKLRFPYKKSIIQKHIRVSCGDLLDFVVTRCNCCV